VSRATIIGGGPAGAAAAITLARGGAAPLLLERTRETGDALCGGFFSWRSLDTLASLGIDAEALGPQRITRARLFAGERVAESPLPRPALAVSRHRLDTLLLAAAGRAGARIERGAHVRRLDEVAGGPILLATGKHDLRGLPRPVEDDPTLGLRVRLAPSPALTQLVADAVELHLFDRGYAGVALQEDGSANVCLAVRRSRLHEAGSPLALLESLASGPLGERLATLDPAAPIDAVANVPYGWRLREGTSGLYRLGDQAGVIPSLAGEGMGIALASGVSAAQAVLARIDAAAWQRDFARRVARPIGRADRIRAVMERPALTPALLAVARLAPALVGWAANATRIPPNTRAIAC
jgi:flavin-dependent dehydrogenase